MTRKADELEGCPFCGERAAEAGGVGCLNRKCEGSRLQLPRRTWNARPIEDALRAENERLRAENASLREANEIDLGEKTPLIFENTELRAKVSELTRLLGEAEEGIRRLAWKECNDCDGSGYTGWVRGKKVSCESCGGSEDSLGDGWIPNHDNIAETMNSALVQRALKGASR